MRPTMRPTLLLCVAACLLACCLQVKENFSISKYSTKVVQIIPTYDTTTTNKKAAEVVPGSISSDNGKNYTDLNDVSPFISPEQSSEGTGESSVSNDAKLDEVDEVDGAFDEIVEDESNATVTIIDINHNSSLAMDNILSISHDPSKARIQIQLKDDRSCKSPIFRGRLSGRHLSIIKWDHNGDSSIKNHEDADDTRIFITGYYQVPALGKYFLEIIILLCNSSSVLTIGSNLKDHNACVVHPKEHRITSKDAHIFVSKHDTNHETTLGLGSWTYQHPSNHPLYDGTSDISNTHNNNETGSSRFGNNETEMGQIFTRYQPQDCRRNPAKQQPPCSNATSMARFEHFEFHWNAQTEAALKSLPSAIHEDDLVCGVGWSHTRHFRQHLASRQAKHLNISQSVFSWHKANYIHKVDETFIENMFHSNCTKLLFSLGQWDAQAGAPLANWQTSISKIISHTSVMNEKRKAVGDKEAEIYITSNHYNPLGDEKIKCKPGDYRSPPIIDKYNSISKEICLSTGNCTFIDTNTAVIGPMWDTAPDWCHYSWPEGARGTHYPTAGEVEVAYIFGVMFGLFKDG